MWAEHLLISPCTGLGTGFLPRFAANESIGESGLLRFHRSLLTEKWQAREGDAIWVRSNGVAAARCLRERAILDPTMLGSSKCFPIHDAFRFAYTCVSVGKEDLQNDPSGSSGPLRGVTAVARKQELLIYRPPFAPSPCIPDSL